VPEASQLVQAIDNPRDDLGMCARERRVRGRPRIRALAVAPPPEQIAHCGQVFRELHFVLTESVSDVERLLAPLLPTQGACPLASVFSRCLGREEGASAARGATKHATVEAKLRLDEVVNEVMRNVLVEAGSRVQDSSLTRGEDGRDRIAPSARACEDDVHG